MGGLIGVIHLPPLPGSPRYGGRLDALVDGVSRDAEALNAAAFDGVIIENFGDTPFFPDRVPPVTVATMTRCAVAVRNAAPEMRLGINVLRNDVGAALSIAAALGDTAMVRANIHIAARVTDQGVIEGRAHETLRLRRELGLDKTQLWSDVDVKHSAALEGQPRSIFELTKETLGRGLADAVLVTGTGTGSSVDDDAVTTALRAADGAPVYAASGVVPEALEALMRNRDGHHLTGVIVGSWLRADGRAGGAVDPDRALRFAAAYRRIS